MFFFLLGCCRGVSVAAIPQLIKLSVALRVIIARKLANLCPLQSRGLCYIYMLRLQEDSLDSLLVGESGKFVFRRQLNRYLFFLSDPRMFYIRGRPIAMIGTEI